jgi:hypothetical protein
MADVKCNGSSFAKAILVEDELRHLIAVLRA